MTGDPGDRWRSPLPDVSAATRDVARRANSMRLGSLQRAVLAHVVTSCASWCCLQRPMTAEGITRAVYAHLWHEQRPNGWLRRRVLIALAELAALGLITYRPGRGRRDAVIGLSTVNGRGDLSTVNGRDRKRGPSPVERDSSPVEHGPTPVDHAGELSTVNGRGTGSDGADVQWPRSPRPLKAAVTAAIEDSRHVFSMYEEEEDARARDADDLAWTADWRLALDHAEAVAATRRHQRAADGFQDRPALFPSP